MPILAIINFGIYKFPVSPSHRGTLSNDRTNLGTATTSPSLNPLRIGELLPTLDKNRPLESMDYTPFFHHPSKSTLFLRLNYSATASKIAPNH